MLGLYLPDLSGQPWPHQWVNCILIRRMQISSYWDDLLDELYKNKKNDKSLRIIETDCFGYPGKE